MADRLTEPWHVQHTVAGPTGEVMGYQINGPANFLIFHDEIDDLMALLAGVKVDDAIQQVAPHTRIYPSEVPDPNIDPDTGWAIDPGLMKEQ